MKIRKKVKLSVHNQWRVEHNYITKYGRVANFNKEVYNKDFFKLQNQKNNSNTDYPNLLKLIRLSLIGLLHSLKSCECLTFILL